VLDIIGKVIGLGSQPYVLFFSGSFIKGNHVCIIPVFLNIPAFQALYFIYISDKGHRRSSVYFLARDDVGGCQAWRVCRSMMVLNCSPEVAREMAVIRSCKNLWRILIQHGRNIKARQTRMRGTANGMSHGYEEERKSVDCEDVSYCALSKLFYSISNYARFIGKETAILP
jgi:hypothetical protein